MIVIFGLPGAGKSYVGGILQKYFAYYHFDGDRVLPENMKQKIAANAAISDSMREIFIKKVIEETQKLQGKYKKIVVTQTFIKEKYREQFLRTFSNAQFILVQTNTLTRESRLSKRKKFPLDLKYTRKMCLNFDPPLIPHWVINNDQDGDSSLTKQLALLLGRE